jgi:hypothetical protein
VGAWGPGIFQEDKACDVRDGFRELVGAGTSPDVVGALQEEKLGACRIRAFCCALSSGMGF